MRLLLLSLVVVVTTIATGPIAYAERGAIVVVGKSKPHDQEVVAAAIKDALTGTGWSIIDPPFSAKEVAAVLACVQQDRPWLCIAPTAGDKGVERVVIVHVDPGEASAAAGKTINITEEVVFRGDGVPPTDRRYCEACTDAALAQSSAELTAVLVERASARSGHTTINIHSEPPGAGVELDGNMIGSTDRSVSTSPGKHTIVLQRSGYQPAVREIEVAENATVDVDITMVAVSGSVTPPETNGSSRSRSHLLPGLLVGVGVVAVGVGIYAQAETGAPKTTEQPTRLYNTPAIVGMAAGGALIGVGVFLWLRHTDQPTSKVSTPTASLIPGGGVVGWARSF